LNESNQPAGPLSNQPGEPAGNAQSNPPAPQFANTWKPVTDLYIEEHTSVPAPVIVVPPKAVPGPVSQADPAYRSKAPMSLNILTGFYFLQAAFYLAMAGPPLTSPESGFSVWLAANSRAFIPFAISHRHPEIYVKLVGQALLFMAAISVVVGVMWVLRSWRIRWITMAYALGRVLRTGIYLFAGVASGVGTNLPGDAQAILIFSSCIDILIFGYLAFYPGVKQAFEKTY
jgi:hypothetical protein